MTADMTWTRGIVSALSAGAVLCAAASASAEGDDVKLYDWPDETAPVMIVSDGGVIFLHRDGAPYRAYDWRGSDVESAHVTDIDRDGQPEVIGVGRPTFAVDSTADPMWSLKKGCKIGLVADIVADNKLDLMCSDGREIKVYTHDNQFVWALSIGRRFTSCEAGDTNGDLKADLECKIGSRIARIDGEGKLITAEAEESMIPEASEPYEPFAAVGEEVLTSDPTFDLDGDGEAGESLLVEGDKLILRAEGKPALATIELGAKPQAALVKNLDGEGPAEVVVVAGGKIWVVDGEGRKDSYSLQAKKYGREPLAQLQSVYANGFADDAAAKAKVEQLQDDLSSCYARQVKRSEFAGSGKLLLKLSVDGEGEVTGVERVHSEIADKSVVQCAMKKLEGVEPGAAEGDSASINITMTYTFRAK